MSLFPTDYSRAKDFTDEAGSATDHSNLNTELDNLGAKLNALSAALQLVMRADGKVHNAVVTEDSFTARALALMGSNSFTPKGAWGANAYVVGDMVERENFAYVCAEAHTGANFSVDRAAGRWVRLSNERLDLVPQCRLSYVNTTTVRLDRWEGVHIPLYDNNTGEWLQHVIPSGGVTLAISAMATGVVYRVYAYLNNGVVTLEAATTAEGTDTDTGLPIKGSDKTRLLVGWIRLSGSNVIAETNTAHSVYSKWNTKQKRMFINLAEAGNITSTSYVDIGGGPLLTGACIKDRATRMFFAGHVSNGGVNQTDIRIYEPWNTIARECLAYIPSASQWVPSNPEWAEAPTNSSTLLDLGLQAKVSAGTGSVYGTLICEFDY